MSSRRHGPCLFARKAGDFSFGSVFSAVPKTAPVFLLFGMLLAQACCSCGAPPSHAENAPAGDETVLRFDGIGRRVEIARHPKRIISLAPSVTEVLYMVGAGPRVAGVTLQCDWPAEAVRKPKMGSLLAPNYEAILAARPDLVIASTAGNDRSAILKLAGLGVPVYVTAPRSVETILDTVREIGRITDCAREGELQASRMESRLDEIRRRLAGARPVRAFFITWFDPLLAPGRRTFETELLKLAGAESITSDIDQYYPRCSLEQVLAEKPEVILTVNHPGSPLPDLRRIAGWRDLDAVKHGRVYILRDVLQHPSPRFVDALEDLARLLHPERF